MTDRAEKHFDDLCRHLIGAHTAARKLARALGTETPARLDKARRQLERELEPSPRKDPP